jgi:putative ABC transport system permease protein
MWIKNFKTFLRHLAHNKLYTFITITGFAIALTFVITLSIYIKNELSINHSQQNKDRIFRLVREEHASFSPPIGPWLQNTFPEIESYCRIYDDKGIIRNSEGKKLKARYLLADSTFFNMFSFPLIEGDKETALKTKYSAVLTRQMAVKLFGNISPLGKQVIINEEVPYTVTGVVEDISKNSNLKSCDVILNFRSLGRLWGWDELMSNMSNCSFGLYFLARPHTDLPAQAPQVLEMFKKDFWLYRGGRSRIVTLEPLEETYFSKVPGPGIRQNSKTKVLILLAVVLLILLLSVINYMNLTIAMSGLRAGEIAMKKILGSSRKDLILRHVLETVTLCLVAFTLAVFLNFLLEPTFNNLLDTRLRLSEALSGSNLLIALSFILFIGILSGIIPAGFITKLNAWEVIKGAFRRKSKTVYSKMLISFQYAVVIALLISAWVIYHQTFFMQHHNPGYNTKNILWLQNFIESGRESGLRDLLLKISGVKRVSFVSGNPIDGGNNNSFNYENKPVSFQVFLVDSSFFPMIQMKITPTGVAYSKNGIWLNRQAVKELDLDSLPTSFLFYDGKLPVLGIVDDFNYGSLHKHIGPAMIRQKDPNWYAWNILVQLEGNDLTGTTDKVRKTYLEYNGGLPFDYGFFDESIKQWYEGERRTATIIGYFALLSMIISAMGIFAMAIFYSEQKTKEIGIRKVNGATTGNIIGLLTRDFLKWILPAFLVAAPVAGYAMHRWLEGFAYRIPLRWWIFVAAGLAVVCTALLTVSLQTFRAARRNPADSLRYE